MNLFKLDMNVIFEALQKNRRQTSSIFLCIMAVAGCVLFASFVAQPSEADKQFFLGLSRSRFLIGVVFFTLLLINMGALFLSVTKRLNWRESLYYKLDFWISKQTTPVLTLLYLFLMVMGSLLLMTIPPIPVSLVFLEPVRLRLLAPIIWLLLDGLLLIVLIRFLYDEKIQGREFINFLDKSLLVAGIFLFTFFFYEHIASWMGWVNKIKYSYWNLLAGNFIEGRLYLSNPPDITHDLTLYNGRWYVPSPPVPAILMMPLAYFVGAENISTADFSMFFSAINASLLFLIFDQFIHRQWIKLSRVDVLLLVFLFAFGTPHLWVGISGRFWFVSQILTVTFLGIAVFAALKSWSPWVIGICIGLAVGARPNGLMTLPFVFAITMQIMKEDGKTIDLRKIFSWSFKSVVPIMVAVLGLLYYNHARFDNFFDFGYVTIDGDSGIVQNAQTYGLFSTHYILYNLRVMFLYLPQVDLGGRWPFLPSGAGMSLFLTTPPLIYLFHRYEGKWWVFGAWAAVFFNFVLLVLYHNTGKDQFGYRYILDFFIPLVILLAAALGKKIPWHFIFLLVLSVLINLYGTNWFLNG